VEKTQLTLVQSDPTAEAVDPRRPLAVAVFLLVLGLLSTILGADVARREFPSGQIAEAAVRRSLSHGTQDPQVRSMLRDLRRPVTGRPLQSRTRVAYAALLLALSASVEDTDAAAFHARIAAEFAPVTVPVVGAAAVILARCRRIDESMFWIRKMFGHDPARAARLLAQIEPGVYASQLESGLPDSPGAWLAWSERLSEEGRPDEAREWLERCNQRWPDYLPALRRVAAIAAASADRGTLERLFPADRHFSDEPGIAGILTYRARLRAMAGDLPAAEADLSRALALAGDDRTVALLAGDAYAEAGNSDAARTVWHRGLFELPAADRELRVQLLKRLARLEMKGGHSGTALRLWRSVVELAPEDAEAATRIEELTGYRH